MKDSNDRLSKLAQNSNNRLRYFDRRQGQLLNFDSTSSSRMRQAISWEVTLKTEQSSSLKSTSPNMKKLKNGACVLKGKNNNITGCKGGLWEWAKIDFKKFPLEMSAATSYFSNLWHPVSNLWPLVSNLCPPVSNCGHGWSTLQTHTSNSLHQMHFFLAILDFIFYRIIWSSQIYKIWIKNFSSYGC